MTDEPSTGGRNRCPDFIPGPLLTEHEETARFLVATRRSLAGAGPLAGPRTMRLRLAAARLVRWWPLAAWLVAGSMTGLWLVVGPDSAALFVIASMTTVLATVGTLSALIAATAFEIGSTSGQLSLNRTTRDDKDDYPHGQ